MARRSLLALLPLLALVACGVKRPPVAPLHKPDPVPLKLDCSTTDENCDKTDPNYRPRK